MNFLSCLILSLIMLSAPSQSWSFQLTNTGDLSDTVNQYRAIVSALRNNPYTSHVNPGIRRITNNAGRNVLLVRVNNVDLVIQASNLYLLGYYATNNQNVFYYFRDVENPGTFIFNGQQPYSPTTPTANPTTRMLDFGASYSLLENTAGRGSSRERIQINTANIIESLDEITRFTDGNGYNGNRNNGALNRRLAGATIRIIIAFIEAARFSDQRLAGPIANQLGSGGTYTGSTRLASLVTDWQTISNGVRRLAQEAIPFSLDADLVDNPNDRAQRCVNTLSRASQNVSLLLLPNEDNPGSAGIRQRRSTRDIQTCLDVYDPLKSAVWGQEYRLYVQASANSCGLQWDSTNRRLANNIPTVLGSVFSRNAKFDCTNDADQMIVTFRNPFRLGDPIAATVKPVAFPNQQLGLNPGSITFTANPQNNSFNVLNSEVTAHFRDSIIPGVIGDRDLVFEKIGTSRNFRVFFKAEGNTKCSLQWQGGAPDIVNGGERERDAKFDCSDEIGDAMRFYLPSGVRNRVIQQIRDEL